MFPSLLHSGKFSLFFCFYAFSDFGKLRVEKWMLFVKKNLFSEMKVN